MIIRVVLEPSFLYLVTSTFKIRVKHTSGYDRYVLDFFILLTVTYNKNFR